MVSNIGGDVGGNQFDLMIPGGGVGVFPHGLPKQLKDNGVSNPDLGPTHGGFRAKCGNNKDCVKKMCDDNFGAAGLGDLKAGCYWYVDWFDIADNPNANAKEVSCPAALVSAYKNGKGGGGPITNPTNYTITFNANGGNAVSPATATTTNGKLSNLPTPTRTGYTFNGWFTAATGGTKVDANYTFNANTTIYAQWAATTYTITFNANNGTVTPTSGTTGTDGRLTSLPTPTRSGHTFNGWFTAATGGTAVTTNYTFNANTTIYAQWTATAAATYTITYNVNNGIGTAPAVQTVNAGSSATLASGSGLTRNGFTFSGWNTSAAGNGTNYNAGASFTPTANTTL
jgi:uncharacterized repeat protein (TIGR02543 family)